MKVTSRIALCVVLVSATLAHGAGSHEERVAQAKADFTAKRDNALQSLAELEVSLKAHDVVSKEIVAARKTLDDMMKSRAWRDLESRTTKTQREAKATLEQFLKTARDQLTVPRQQLALIKKAEFEAWSRANPGSAKLRQIQQREEAVKSAAINAQWQMPGAESPGTWLSPAEEDDDNERAIADAQQAQEQAQWQARDAERRARNAQQELQRAQDALRQHGIHSR